MPPPKSDKVMTGLKIRQPLKDWTFAILAKQPQDASLTAVIERGLAEYIARNAGKLPKRERAKFAEQYPDLTEEPTP